MGKCLILQRKVERIIIEINKSRHEKDHYRTVVQPSWRGATIAVGEKERHGVTLRSHTFLYMHPTRQQETALLTTVNTLLGHAHQRRETARKNALTAANDIHMVNFT